MMVELVGRPETVRPSQDGIFVECKPVDANHSLLTCYCDAGIQRFICGEYAWAMSEAMMIGYVNSSEDPVAKIQSALDARKAKVLPVQTTTTCPHSASKPPTAITTHHRSFSYIETGQKAPDIVLRHLWLSRN
jgi:hypothetical protein